MKEPAEIKRVDRVKYLDQYKIQTRALFAVNVISQPYVQAIECRMSGSRENTDGAMNQKFWLGVERILGEEHFNYTAIKLEQFIGANVKC